MNACEGARVATWEKYAEIWNDASRLELAVSIMPIDEHNGLYSQRKL